MYETVTLYGVHFHTLPLCITSATARSYYPMKAGTFMVWALPRSLATTGGIIVYFLFLKVLRCFSSLRSPQLTLMTVLQTAGLSHSEIRGSNGHLHLPAAYRSLSRPSSPVRAKASAICPYLLSLALQYSCLCNITCNTSHINTHIHNTEVDYTFS